MHHGSIESREVLLLSWVRLDDRVLDGQSSAVALSRGDQLHRSVFPFINPIAVRIGPRVVVVNGQESLKQRPLLTRLRRHP